MAYEDLTQKKNELEKLPPLNGDVEEELRKTVDLELTSVGDCFDGGALTRRETEQVLFKDKVVPQRSLTEHIQALNISKAFEMIQELAARTGRPVDDSDVKNIHRVIVRELDDKNGGMFRGFAMTFPTGDQPLPEPVRVQRMMDDFGMWLYTVRTLHPVAMAAEAHLRLMSIHPFGKGNGKTARMLMNLILMKNGYPPALFSRREKKEYWQSLESAIYNNDRTDYDKLICRAVNRALELYLKTAKKQTVDVEDESVPYFLRIGQLAKETGERVSTIRYWTTMGIIEPVGKTSADYMIYSSDVLGRIKKLKDLKAQRYTLDEIKLRLGE
ncbi:MAG TPA: hypothetical protein DD624_01270 [Alphaproteobacteria bacterium]|nr:hypothetical protein [Alphaproteobacteria bacterium]